MNNMVTNMVFGMILGKEEEKRLKDLGVSDPSLMKKSMLYFGAVSNPMVSTLLLNRESKKLTPGDIGPTNELTNQIGNLIRAIQFLPGDTIEEILNGNSIDLYRDNLTQIGGITQAAELALNLAGILTFEDLKDAAPSEIDAIFTAANIASPPIASDIIDRAEEIYNYIDEGNEVDDDDDDV